MTNYFLGMCGWPVTFQYSDGMWVEQHIAPAELDSELGAN
jgi:hypothetical protein